MGGYHDGQHDQMDSDAKELQGMRMLGQKDENMPAESVQISCETVKEKAELLRLLCFDQHKAAQRAQVQVPGMGAVKV